jgi:hypothetical protein
VEGAGDEDEGWFGVRGGGGGDGGREGEGEGEDGDGELHFSDFGASRVHGFASGYPLTEMIMEGAGFTSSLSTSQHGLCRLPARPPACLPAYTPLLSILLPYTGIPSTTTALRFLGR